MTTFWARMLIFRAWENGEITEECAHYFDDLLNHYKTNCELHEIKDFNADDRLCVLRKIGIDDECEFHVLDYIKKTTFEKEGEKPVYLANIIKEDYTRLGEEITNYMNNKEANLNGLMSIYDYLICTFYKYQTSKEENIELMNKLSSKIISLGGKRQANAEVNNQTKTNDKPAYTDLIDADY